MTYEVRNIREEGLDKLSKKGFLSVHQIGKLAFCGHCAYGKQNRVKFRTKVHKM